VFWRPSVMHRGEIVNIESYRSVEAEGRRILLVYPHFGQMYASAPTLARFGINVYLVLASHHYDDTGESYEVRFARRARQYVDELGEGHHLARGDQHVKAEGTFARMHEHLLAGRPGALAWDLPGSMPTPFFGRMLSLASGPAKLAHLTEAVVVPFVMGRRETIPVLRFGPPIDSRDFDSPEELQAAIARHLETRALEHPEVVWSVSTQPGGPALIRGPIIADNTAAQPTS